MKTTSKTELIDVYGQGIADHYHGDPVVLTTISSIAGEDILPVEYLFRDHEQMPSIEQKALSMAKGRVIDLGCGAGSHSLYLQNQGFDVTGLDISEKAADICKKRGLRKVRAQDMWQLKDEQFDTILALMNGAGICGTLHRVPAFLKHLRTLLNKDGQILMDSSDLIYMFEDEEGFIKVPDLDRYYGEVQFEVIHRGISSGEFPWLYIDYPNLSHLAQGVGLHCELVMEGAHYDYLARLTLD